MATHSNLTFVCEKCGKTIAGNPIRLSGPYGEGDDVFWCNVCWQKDLDNDSGNYFDNFVDR